MVFFIVGCLKCYARDTVNPVNGKSMHQLHQATVEKVNYLEDRWYIVVQVWECDIERELERDEEMRRYFDNYEIVDPIWVPFFAMLSLADKKRCQIIPWVQGGGENKVIISYIKYDYF